MITKAEANRWTIDSRDNIWLVASIFSDIYNSIFRQKFHCDWYSPAHYDMTEDEVAFVMWYADYLENKGYAVTKTIYERTDDFPCQRVKLHINWE